MLVSFSLRQRRCQSNHAGDAVYRWYCCAAASVDCCRAGPWASAGTSVSAARSKTCVRHSQSLLHYSFAFTQHYCNAVSYTMAKHKGTDSDRNALQLYACELTKKRNKFEFMYPH
eukprot:10812-Heterococcus_DN1.PRE.1